jgi:hypothetical protein
MAAVKKYREKKIPGRQGLVFLRSREERNEAETQ